MPAEGLAKVVLQRGAGRASPSGATYALEFGSQRLLIAEGEHIVGRAYDCDIVLDCELVSRRHARLTLTGAAVFVEDLGSVNGVTVNGVEVKGKTLVAPDSRIGFADAEVVLRHRDTSDARVTKRVPASGSERRDSGVDPIAGQDTEARRVRAFELLTNVLEKAFTMGQPEEAERLVGALLREVLADAERGHTVPDAIAETASKHSLRLAATTDRREWADYAVRLYLARERVMPLSYVDRLYSIARGAARIDVALIERYARLLDGMRLAPADRFVLQRLRSLARMLTPASGR